MKFEVRDNSLIINDFELFDESGNRSVMQGIIKNRYFRDFDFDLNLQAENFNFLQTREVHNQAFYGDAMASGLIRFDGQPGNLHLVVSAKTEKGTHIFIPINQGRDLQENNFITFIQPDSLVVEDIDVGPVLYRRPVRACDLILTWKSPGMQLSKLFSTPR